MLDKNHYFFIIEKIYFIREVKTTVKGSNKANREILHTWDERRLQYP